MLSLLITGGSGLHDLSLEAERFLLRFPTDVKTWKNESKHFNFFFLFFLFVCLKYHHLKYFRKGNQSLADSLT